MASAENVTKSLVPISQFNRGQASRIFDRLQTEDHLIVLKKNKPTAVILSPAEYDRLMEIEEDNYLLAEAYERLQRNDEYADISMNEMMSSLGITDEDLDAVGDVVIE